MSRKVTVELNESLYEMLVWVSNISDMPIDKLLIIAAYETFFSEELENSKKKQDSLIEKIDNWLDSIREGTSTDEEFILAKESASELQKVILKERLKFYKKNI